MVSALDLLASIPPSESGGPLAQNRFAYQSDWTFCLLLGLHQQENDYVVVCDYHDDIVVSNHSHEIPMLDFYQVKTSATKPWTLKHLLQRKKGKNGLLHSIIGKLYTHRIKFTNAVRTLNFVSHPPLSGNSLPDIPTNGTSLLFKASELYEEDRIRLSKHLRQELELDTDPEIDDILLFHKTSLDLSRHDRDTIGELAQYLEKRDPSRSYKPVPMYHTISREIIRKSRCEGVFNTSEDIHEYKSISRNDFEDMIVTCIQEHDRLDPKLVQQGIRQVLINEGMLFNHIRSIEQKLQQYLIERMGTSLNVKELIKQAKSIATTLINNNGIDFVTMLKQGAAIPNSTRAGKHHDTDYLMAVIAWEVFTYERELSSSNPESAREKV